MMLEPDSQIRSSCCVEETCRQVCGIQSIKDYCKCIVVRYSTFSSPATFFVGVEADASLFASSPLCKLDNLFEFMHTYYSSL